MPSQVSKYRPQLTIEELECIVSALHAALTRDDIDLYAIDSMTHMVSEELPLPAELVHITYNKLVMYKAKVEFGLNQASYKSKPRIKKQDITAADLGEASYAEPEPDDIGAKLFGKKLSESHQAKPAPTKVAGIESVESIAYAQCKLKHWNKDELNPETYAKGCYHKMQEDRGNLTEEEYAEANKYAMKLLLGI